MKTVPDFASAIAVGLALGAYGIFWILSGADAIKTQRAYGMHRGARRDKPMLVGAEAVGMGKFRIGIGLLLIALGLWPILAAVLSVLL